MGITWGRRHLVRHPVQHVTEPRYLLVSLPFITAQLLRTGNPASSSLPQPTPAALQVLAPYRPVIASFIPHLWWVLIPCRINTNLLGKAYEGNLLFQVQTALLPPVLPPHWPLALLSLSVSPPPAFALVAPTSYSVPLLLRTAKVRLKGPFPRSRLRKQLATQHVTSLGHITLSSSESDCAGVFLPLPLPTSLLA